jgi:hypothetical protein
MWPLPEDPMPEIEKPNPCQQALDIAEIRRGLCSVIADLGGVADHLRTIEETENPQNITECWSEVADWLDSAQQEITAMSQMAVNRSESAL